MALEMPDQQLVDLVPSRGSKIQPADTYARPAIPIDNGDSERLKASLESLGANLQGLGADQERKQIEEQKQNMDLYVSQVQAGIKDGVYDPNAANNVLSPLHPAVRALVTQSVGTQQGALDAQKEVLPPDALLAPEKGQAWLEERAKDALGKVGSTPFYSAGYMQAYRSGLTSMLGQGAGIRRNYNNDQIIKGAITGVGQAGQPGAQIDTSKSRDPQAAAAVAQGARNVGIAPQVLAAAISYETGGSFDPAKKGPTTKWGQMQGLIQMGESQRREFGYDITKSVAENMPAVEKYLIAHGVKPGMGLPEVYSAIIAGDANYDKVKNRSDGYGTVQQHVAKIMAGHMQKGLAFLGMATQVAPTASADAQGSSGKGVQVASASQANDASGNAPTASLAPTATDGTPTPVPRPADPPMKPRPQDAAEETAAPAAAPTSPYADKSPAPVQQDDGTTHYSGGYDAYKEYTAKADKGEKVVWDGAGPSQYKPDAPTPAQVQQQNQVKYGITAQTASKLTEEQLNMNHHWINADGTIKSVQPYLKDATRDEAVKQFQAAALSSRDEGFLDAFPPKQLTASQQIEFTNTRQQIKNLKMADWRQKNEMDEFARKEETRQKESDIAKQWDKDPTGFDPVKMATRKDGSVDTALLDYGLKMRDKDKIPEAKSSVRKSDLEEKIAGAYATGDFSKIDPKLVGKTPSVAELTDILSHDPQLGTKDMIALKEKLPKLANAYVMLQDPEIDKYYNDTIGNDIVRTYSGSIQGGVDKLMGTRISGQVKETFMANLRLAWKTSIQETGEAPHGQAYMTVMEKARDAAITKFESIAKTIKPEEPAKPAEGGAKPAGKGSVPAPAKPNAEPAAAATPAPAPSIPIKVNGVSVGTPATPAPAATPAVQTPAVAPNATPAAPPAEKFGLKGILDSPAAHGVKAVGDFLQGKGGQVHITPEDSAALRQVLTQPTTPSVGSD